MKAREHTKPVVTAAALPASRDRSSVLQAGKYVALASAALTAALLTAAWAPFAQAAPAVTGRSANAIVRDYGRAGGDAFWEQRQPTAIPAPITNAFDATERATVHAYDDTKAALRNAGTFLTQPPGQSLARPQRYGRAGGYVGLDVLTAQPWRAEPHTMAAASGSAGQAAAETDHEAE